MLITGSVVNANTLFAYLQSVTAQQIGISPALLVAANVVGGVMGKLISLQSITIAAAATNQVGQESQILRRTLAYSLGLVVAAAVLIFVLSFVLPG
ncbi:L-lactate permease [Paenirhodobacter sp.]|uniref:L-lactate permease n=1 Tax=Paenirhodobacter sp. TaxID=1965326 RepID=UPI003B50C6FE